MKNRPIQSIMKVFGYKMFFVVNIVILLLLGLSFGREFVRSSAISKEIGALESEKASLEEKNLSLSAYQEYLETEAFLEYEAREKFGLQRPGETQVHIEEGGAPVNVETAVALFADGEVVIPTWKLWMWYFFDPDVFEDYVAT
ncbi:MAG TPA: septum formation initiator family protein [Patescibacteria group bacterium]|nr:septum formation initiator family protein [Patescibacteria group bacterium]|tara:strand:+ start:454 stop:882 length:429 start_codon:yes stop_codon:yes gene_type:complete